MCSVRFLWCCGCIYAMNLVQAACYVQIITEKIWGSQLSVIYSSIAPARLQSFFAFIVSFLNFILCTAKKVFTPKRGSPSRHWWRDPSSADHIISNVIVVYKNNLALFVMTFYRREIRTQSFRRAPAHGFNRGCDYGGFKNWWWYFDDALTHG